MTLRSFLRNRRARKNYKRFLDRFTNIYRKDYQP